VPEVSIDRIAARRANVGAKGVLCDLRYKNFKIRFVQIAADGFESVSYFILQLQPPFLPFRH